MRVGAVLSTDANVSHRALGTARPAVFATFQNFFAAAAGPMRFGAAQSGRGISPGARPAATGGDFTLWLATAHSDATLQSPQRLAPSKTSIYAGAPVRYYEVPLSRFHLVKNFGEPKPQALLDFINGKTSPLPENFVYPRQ